VFYSFTSSTEVYAEFLIFVSNVRKEILIFFYYYLDPQSVKETGKIAMYALIYIMKNIL
jgi:hypothetical protein